MAGTAQPVLLDSVSGDVGRSTMSDLFNTIDEAFALLRKGGVAFFFQCIFANLPLAITAIGMFYLEKIEGVRDLRFVFAALFVLAWWWRAIYASRAARGAVLAVAPNTPVDVPSNHRTIHLASLVAIAFTGWAWLLAFASWAGVVGLLLVYPLLCLRGLFGPSWIARSGCRRQGALSAWSSSLGDTTDRRSVGLLCEALVLLGTLPLALNLYALLSGAVMIARSFLALDVATVSAFLSPSNGLVTGSVVVVGLVCTDVVRIALSAVHFVESEVRNKGLDLADMLSEIEKRAGTTMALLLMVLTLFMGSTAIAQAPVLPQPSPQDPSATVETQDLASPKQKWLTDEDMEVRKEVDALLRKSEYVEHIDVEQGTGIRRFFSKLWDWLVDFMSKQEKLDLDKKAQGLKLPLPPAWIFVVFAAALLLGVLGYIAYHRDFRRSVRVVLDDEEFPLRDDPRDKAPDEHLDEAALLAREGKHRQALRSLYLATLVSLDRRGLITFDPSLTNWQYIRTMPRSEKRDQFGTFTELFDYKWYGEETTTPRDYEESRRLATEICA